jgi:NADPH:quinone reductase-like Zn-dependent oxidoreductase
VKAAVAKRYGDPPSSVAAIHDLDVPVPADDEVLVRVHASSVNIADWYGIVGRPWIARPGTGLRAPKSERLGVDYAGVVEAVGARVTDFEPGDEVFGGRDGAFAEYVAGKADRAIVPKPANVSFEDAAGVGVAATTALQAVRDKGGLQPGQRVIVNGASGGVGSYTVQIAKAFGGEVTAVCSTQNAETAHSLGADRVCDYTQEDFTRSGERYDLVLDVAGGRSWSEWKRVLAPEATFVVVGGPRKGRLLGPIGDVARLKLRGTLGGHKVVFFVAKLNKADMQVLADLMGSGKIRTVVDRRYELERVGEALDYIGEGHARGKILVTV